MKPLRQACKEWAVVCKALETGKQAILIRKGGIAEATGDFRVEFDRFWLYPTFVHQQETGIAPEFAPMLAQVRANQPPQGTIALTHWAEVKAVYHAHDIVGALRLGDLHILSVETVQARFHYRDPGLFVLLLRVYRAPELRAIIETPAYAGCRTWVELEEALPTEGSVPILTDEAIREQHRLLEECLNPTAWA